MLICSDGSDVPAIVLPVMPVFVVMVVFTVMDGSIIIFVVMPVIWLYSVSSDGSVYSDVGNT